MFMITLLSNMTLSLLILICFMLLPKSDSVTIIINGNEKLAKINKINGVDFIELKILSEIFDADISDKYIISKRNETLKFAAGSFFSVYEKAGRLRAAQLNSPAVQGTEQQLYIPLNSFLIAYQGLGLLNFEISGKKYIIGTEMFRILNRRPVQINTEKHQANDSLKNADSLKHKPKYMIPEKLIK